MEWYDCEHCGRPAIHRDEEEDWKTKCIFCWKADEDYELTMSELYALRLEEELVKLNQEMVYRTVTAQKNAQFTKKELGNLLRLCHPDMHGGSKLSTEVTQKLLDMRKP